MRTQAALRTTKAQTLQARRVLETAEAKVLAAEAERALAQARRHWEQAESRLPP